MIARMMPAVRMPMPSGGAGEQRADQRQLSPSVAFSSGCTWDWKIGAKTNSPHMP